MTQNFWTVVYLLLQWSYSTTIQLDLCFLTETGLLLLDLGNGTFNKQNINDHMAKHLQDCFYVAMA